MKTITMDEAIEVIVNNLKVDPHFSREFNLILISAENLPDVRKLFDNRVYAKITMGDDESTEEKTNVDEKNGLNPLWNFRVTYNLKDSSIMQESLSVVVKLYTKRTLGHRCIGEVDMPLKSLFDHWSSAGSTAVSFPVQGAGSSAVLNVSCSFGERFWVKKATLWKKALVTVATILFRLTLRAAPWSTMVRE